NELLAKNDIVSVLSSYMELRPKGRRLWGLCPLHGEKTASFSVSPDKQLFYCFGCHAGGSVIQFIMDMERLSFPEAVRFLAERAGMAMPEETDDAELRRRRAYRERLYEATRRAARFYMERLLSEEGREARAYLARRRITGESVKRFGIGCAPEGWDRLLRHMTDAGFSERELLDAGLLVKNPQSGRVYDAYRNRLIFPIVGTNGRVLGFGARTLGDDKPKYINTGDTPLYNKRNNLYGLYLMKGERLSDLVIVEGYTDVIGLYEAGVRNAVASLGTALTVQQARLIKRYVDTVYIAYDGDAAGQNATIRGLDILRDEGLAVRVVVFPGGQDPDEFIRAQGKEAFDALRDNALSLQAFKLESMAGGYALDTENGREAYAMAACRFIAGLQPIERDRYYQQLARKTGYPVEALKAQGAAAGSEAAASPVRRSPAWRRPERALSGESGRTRAEQALLTAMLQSREAAMAVKPELEGLFSEAACARFAAAVIAAYEAGREPSAAAILAGMESAEAGMLSAVAGEDARIAEPEQAARDCLRRIRRYGLEARLGTLRESLNDTALGAERRAEVLNEIQKLTRQLQG
ncbi:MAG: DNA primase, partial [Clostridia bacterium]|nr:DNA primase [Clostridia bacterium]